MSATLSGVRTSAAQVDGTTSRSSRSSGLVVFWIVLIDIWV
jgi:hypothetical protein